MTEPRRDLRDEGKSTLNYDKQRDKEVADEATLKEKLKNARDGN